MTKAVLTEATLDLVRNECIRAGEKHGWANTMLNPMLTHEYKLGSLVEEAGEVAKLFTYDQRRPDGSVDRAALIKELVQTANIALAWAQCEQVKLEREEYLDRTRVPASDADIP
jgi:hypothetical protein